MTFSGQWAGYIYGTDTGNLFLSLKSDEDSISGTLSVRRDIPGDVSYEKYALEAEINGTHVSLNGEIVEPQEAIPREFLAAGNLFPDGRIRGTWNTSQMAEGTFVLLPHNAASEQPSQQPQANQLHTKRLEMGAISIDRKEIERLGQAVADLLPEASVIVTINADSEQTRYLKDFSTLDFSFANASAVRLFARAPEGGGIDKIISVELGKTSNVVMAQSADQSWALGTAELLQQRISPLVRKNAILARRASGGINTFLFICLLAYLPELPSTWQRLVILFAAAAIAMGINWLQTRLVPLANIVITDQEPSPIQKIVPAVLQWALSILTAILVAALTVFAKEGTVKLVSILSSSNPAASGVA